MSDLLPCPFCGGAAMCYRDIDGDFQVFCNAEGCTIETGHYGKEAEARAMWNRRSPAVMSPDETGSQNADETKGNSHEQ